MSAILIVLVTGTLAAAWIDVRRRTIPNWLTGTLAVAALALHLSAGATALLLSLLVMGVVFALGAVAFSAGWFGGGDVKLVAVACGLVSLPGCFTLVLSISIAGAVLALAQAAREHRLGSLLRNASVLAQTGSVPGTRTLLPYGVAIAGGSTAYALSTLLPAVRLPL